MSSELTRRMNDAGVNVDPKRRKMRGPDFPGLKVVQRDSTTIPNGVELRSNPATQKVQPILTPTLAKHVGLIKQMDTQKEASQGSTNANATMPVMVPSRSYSGGMGMSANPGGLSPWLVDAVATLHESNKNDANGSRTNSSTTQPPTFATSTGASTGFTPGGSSGLTPTGFTPMFNQMVDKGPFERVLRSTSTILPNPSSGLLQRPTDTLPVVSTATTSTTTYSKPSHSTPLTSATFTNTTQPSTTTTQTSTSSSSTPNVTTTKN